MTDNKKDNTSDSIQKQLKHKRDHFCRFCRLFHKKDDMITWYTDASKANRRSKACKWCYAIIKEERELSACKVKRKLKRKPIQPVYGDRRRKTYDNEVVGWNGDDEIWL